MNWMYTNLRVAASLLGILGLISCGEATSYDYLSEQFPVVTTADDDRFPLDSGAVSVSRPLQVTDTLRLSADVIRVAVTKASVVFEPADPTSAASFAFEVPANAIHSCSCQRGDVTAFVLILDEAATQILVADAYELVEWCWLNELPMLTSNARRDWLYNGATLPGKEELAESMVSREAYDEIAEQACLGY